MEDLSMRWCLDTDHISFALRGVETLIGHLQRTPRRELCITAVTLAELEWSSLRHPHPQSWDPRWRHFIRGLPVLAFTRTEAPEHARIRLECRQQPIGERDLIIASICRANHLTLVSDKSAELGRVNGLRVENWAR
jgi:predicted nucleic acid-binding protein